MSYNSLLDPTYAELGLFLSIQMTEKSTEKSKKVTYVRESYAKSKLRSELTRISRQLDRIESFIDDFLT